MTETEAILNRAVTLDELKLLKLRYMRALQTDTILLADDPEGKLDTPGLYLTDDERTTHMHVMGSSGGGKSKLLEFMIRQDIQRGVGVCVIDPHAELYWNILRYIIEECDDDIKEKVYLINPSQWDYMVSYNPLLMKMGDANSHSLRLIECLDKVFKGEITEKSGIYETLKAVFKLAAIRGFSFHEVKKLLYDKQFRTELVKSFNHSPLGNRELEEFWIKSVNTKVFDDILFWSKSKIDVLSESSPLEMMTLQDESLDLREIIKRNGILLVNLADQAVFNKKSARTLGTMLVSELISNFKDEGGEDFITGKGTKRSPFYMYVDEFHEVYTDDFRIIISGLRKFKLHLVLSNQELGQL
ncbi:type IV secretory system conjugative DNA transfer family protein, partial [bacterium]|nr:type IV secretory system conjugative DNA transfer family protein [bacterium]